MQPSHPPAKANRVEVIQLLPKRRFDRPEWEIRVGGTVVGWVKEVRLRGARATFYEAHARRDGKIYRLELTTDLDERIAKVLEFWNAPWKAIEVIDRA